MAVKKCETRKHGFGGLPGAGNENGGVFMATLPQVDLKYRANRALLSVAWLGGGKVTINWDVLFFPCMIHLNRPERDAESGRAENQIVPPNSGLAVPFQFLSSLTPNETS